MSSIWIVRPGYHNEYQAACLDENRIFLPVPLLEGIDFTQIETYGDIRRLVQETFDEELGSRLTQLTDVMADFVLQMMCEDIILMPMQDRQHVAIGRVLSPYGYDSDQAPPLRHLREVEWLSPETPMDQFGVGLQATFDTQKLITRVLTPGAENQIIPLIGHRRSSVDKERSATHDIPPVTPEVGFEVRLDPVNAASIPSDRSNPDRAGSKDRVSVQFTEAVPERPPTTEPRAAKLEPILHSNAPHSSMTVTQAIHAFQQREGLLCLITELLKADGCVVVNLGQDLLLASRGNLGLDRPYILVQVLAPTRDTIEIDAQHLKVLRREYQIDRSIIVSFEIDLPTELERQLRDQGLILWRRTDIETYLQKVYHNLDPKIQSAIGLQTRWCI